MLRRYVTEREGSDDQNKTLQSHPDAEARAKMLEKIHQCHCRSATEPEAGFRELQRLLEDQPAEGDHHHYHRREASLICAQILELLDKPNASRGPEEVGRLVALINHLVHARVFRGQTTEA